MTDAVCDPRPVQQPHPPLWFGEATPGILDICARSVRGGTRRRSSIPELRRRSGCCASACERAGRDLIEIELSLETQILIAPDSARCGSGYARWRHWPKRTDSCCRPNPAVPAHLRRHEDFRAFVAGEIDELPGRMADDWVVGTPDEVETRLRAYIAEGINHFMLWFMDVPGSDGLELFAESIAPRFRK